MKDWFLLSISFWLVLTVFAKTLVRNNTTGNVQLSTEISDNNVPDLHLFSWRLCKALHDTEKNNAVLSSISVKLVLLMLHEGALGNTAKQIENVVGFSGRKQNLKDRFSQKLQSLQIHDKDDYELHIGTKLFFGSSVQLKNEYLLSISKWYNASYEEVDFSKPGAAVNSINQWAKNITNGHIEQLITEDETKENTGLFLLNAIYFKGYWSNPFNKDLTKDGPFYLNSKTVINVPLMTTWDNFQISTVESLNARLLSLPYAGNKFVMFIILPDSADGLDDLVNKINPTLLAEYFKKMKTLSAKVVLPKFNFDYISILGPILQKLGIVDMFGQNADLRNMGNGPLGSLFVSNILQKAGLEVNEQGSTAFAATEVDLDHRVGVSVDTEFIVNKPFLFMIEDITMNTIAFVGQVLNPLSKGVPLVSIPIMNAQSSTKPDVDEELSSKIKLDQYVNSPRFAYFDSELFQEIGSNQPDSNFVSSPTSIKIILSLLSEGARGNTLKELNSLLRLPNDQSTLHNLLRRTQLSMKSSKIDLAVANNIFVKNKNGISLNFKDTATDLYEATISEINFQNIEATVQLINEQISSDTNGLLNNVISKDDFDGNTELLLSNVLYFKGDWLVEFNENKTKYQCFYSKSNVCVEVSMMNLQSDVNYGYISDISAQAIEIPYKDENFSMVILLPDENISFLQLLKDLQHNPIPKVINSLHQRTVNLYLPRFEINYSTRLSTVLKKMGLNSIFDKNAELTSIFNPEKQVFVGDVIHKVTIAVDEKGSKASAATVASVQLLSNNKELPVVTVNVNRPFAFFIFNRVTKNMLFSGHLHNVNSNAPFQQINFINTAQTNNYNASSLVQRYQQPQTNKKQSIKY